MACRALLALALLALLAPTGALARGHRPHGQLAKYQIGLELQGTFKLDYEAPECGCTRHEEITFHPDLGGVHCNDVALFYGGRPPRFAAKVLAVPAGDWPWMSGEWRVEDRQQVTGESCKAGGTLESTHQPPLLQADYTLNDYDIEVHAASPAEPFQFTGVQGGSGPCATAPTSGANGSAANSAPVPIPWTRSLPCPSRPSGP